MNQKQICNPFLPLDVCIPDGEPHVFDGRIYLFGSHEALGGKTFCCKPYTFYSAPVDDLKNWSAPGESYCGEGDPHVTAERRCLYAPDVVRGNDGKFYLYYGLEGYAGPISVAISDRPDGKYTYLGDVRNPDGSPWRRFVAFDPAVINDDGVIRLYYGTWYPFEDSRTSENAEQMDRAQMMMFGKSLEELHGEPGGVTGPVTVQLAEDMLTVISEPKRIMPSKVKGTLWETHPFYEGASIRKIGARYYFIYSSWKNHELCYAVSDKPDEGFAYQGTIISNGDVGYQGRLSADRLNATGNNHGSIEEIGGQWYVFYHRHTHGREQCRQACAEPIQILEDGTIPQVEMTSCGLNGAPLSPEGTYPAAICCNLTNGAMPHMGTDKEGHREGAFPFIGSENGQTFIRGIRNGTQIGYKYFDHKGSVDLEICYRGEGAGEFLVSTRMDGKILAHIPVMSRRDWATARTAVPFPEGKGGVFLNYVGSGTFELRTIAFEKAGEAK